MSKDNVVALSSPEGVEDLLTELLRQSAKRLIQHCWPSIPDNCINSAPNSTETAYMQFETRVPQCFLDFTGSEVQKTPKAGAMR